ncbi:hypothetical protein ACH4E7_12780 [Kitasatospora sp. NPDC018058]
MKQLTVRPDDTVHRALGERARRWPALSAEFGPSVRSVRVTEADAA